VDGYKTQNVKHAHYQTEQRQRSQSFNVLGEQSRISSSKIRVDLPNVFLLWFSFGLHGKLLSVELARLNTGYKYGILKRVQPVCLFNINVTSSNDVKVQNWKRAIIANLIQTVDRHNCISYLKSLLFFTGMEFL
jgi:hypothetical protein